MQIGFIGLGRMGSHMAEKLVKAGHEVVVWNRTHDKAVEFVKNVGGAEAASIQDLIQKLTVPRVVWAMLPHGEVTDGILAELFNLLAPGDIVVNGANDHFENTERWAKKFTEKQIKFLGIGVSGGLVAATAGYPMMVGGDPQAYEKVKPILDALASPHGGYEYFGSGGAGHYVKMVHNAIEYGFMQSIGEGLELLHSGPYKEMDVVKVTNLWQKGTLVSGFILDRTREALTQDPRLEQLRPFVEDTGEGRWAVEVALKNSIPLSVLTESLYKRYFSRQENSFALRAVAAMRKVFGGHKVKEK